MRWKIYRATSMPVIMVERPSAENTMSAAARAASVAPCTAELWLSAPSAIKVRTIAQRYQTIAQSATKTPTYAGMRSQCQNYLNLCD